MSDTKQCKRGHLLDAANIAVSPAGKKSCRTCGRDRWNRYRARKIKAGTWKHGRTEKDKTQKRVWQKQYRKGKEVSRKQNARHTVFIAIKNGKLSKLPCKRCGALKVEAHHSDYSKPLEIIWLCVPCHTKEHRATGRA